jgi:hypothetical protein
MNVGTGYHGTGWRYVVLCALLVGCQTTGTERIALAEEHRTKAIVVGSYREVPATPLTLDIAAATTVLLDHSKLEKTFAFDKPGGNQEIVHVFRLPVWSTPYSVQLTSYVMGGLNDPALFYPRLTFLNEAFEQTRESKQSDFVYRGVGAHGGISTDVFINDSNRGEAYIAITSETRGAIEEHLSVMQSAGSMPLAIAGKGVLIMWMIPTGGTELPKKMRAAASGQFQLKLIPYAPKRPTASP